VLHPLSFTQARLNAGLSRDDLAARAAAIGHRDLDRYPPGDHHEYLREDLREYINLAERGDLHDDNTLPTLHPYIRWLAQATDTTVLRLIDQPLQWGGTPRKSPRRTARTVPAFSPRCQKVADAGS
jgi:hypothetical protein